MKIFFIVVLVCLSAQLICPYPAIGEEIDYTPYGSLLKKYVFDGEIDYLNWQKNDFEVFEEYVKGLEGISLANLGEDERKAFWLNAYNALTIYAVLKRMPDKSFLAKVFSVQMVPGFFDNITYSVAGEDLTLNDIENQKLREDFEDPRIHFAIVCASRSCPKIQNKVFTPKRLDKRLDAAARIFLQDEYRNRLNKEKNTLYLSQIFDWFDGDFIKESGSVVDYVKQYLPKKDTRYISKNSIKVKHLFYNWILNIK